MKVENLLNHVDEPWETFDNFHIQILFKEKHNKFVVHWDFEKLSHSHGGDKHS